MIISLYLLKPNFALAAILYRLFKSVVGCFRISFITTFKQLTDFLMPILLPQYKEDLTLCHLLPLKGSCVSQGCLSAGGCIASWLFSQSHTIIRMIITLLFLRYFDLKWSWLPYILESAKYSADTPIMVCHHLF